MHLILPEYIDNFLINATLMISDYNYQLQQNPKIQIFLKYDCNN